MRCEARLRVGIGVIAAVFFLANGLGCGGSDASKTVNSLTICTVPLCTGSAKTLTLTEGQPRQVFATATYANGGTKDVTANSMWLSTNQTCAAVGTGSGLVTAAPSVPNACTSDVSASFGPATSTTTVTVTPGTQRSINVVPSTITPVGGSTMTFTAMGVYGGTSRRRTSPPWSPGIAILLQS
jgi:trimeric autotransporter adhesin